MYMYFMILIPYPCMGHMYYIYIYYTSSALRPRNSTKRRKSIPLCIELTKLQEKLELLFNFNGYSLNYLHNSKNFVAK